ncbi:XkdN-like tail assembly chaperone [Tumebacillus sp. BK434]|uniref:phage tail assembly chaperone n=1 Tax=Tumebacillus sp. BK434 TaxID=2512169 RepID=UPI001047861E|nr:hypothetical protein [Tumebacillus sp. BK434]TCP57977.1 XkdN-like tail assembly chaperone [Tumebacillus sp. BK434]
MKKEETKSLAMTQDLYVDPLEALLSVDADKSPEDDVYLKRLNAKFRVRGPKQSEYKATLERCVKETGKGKNLRRSLDTDMFQKLLVHTFTVSPNLADPKLAEKYGALVAEEVVEKALLPGEVDKLAERILELGGYGEDDDLVEEAKN